MRSMSSVNDAVTSQRETGARQPNREKTSRTRHLGLELKIVIVCGSGGVLRQCS